MNKTKITNVQKLVSFGIKQGIYANNNKVA